MESWVPNSTRMPNAHILFRVRAAIVIKITNIETHDIINEHLLLAETYNCLRRKVFTMTLHVADFPARHSTHLIPSSYFILLFWVCLRWVVRLNFNDGAISCCKLAVWYLFHMALCSSRLVKYIHCCSILWFSGDRFRRVSGKERCWGVQIRWYTCCACLNFVCN